jgi:hypothetical protein
MLGVADARTTEQAPQALDPLVTCAEPVHGEPTSMLTLKLPFFA